MKNKNCADIFFEGLESVLEDKKFEKMQRNVCKTAAEKIINDTLKGNIKWRRKMGRLRFDETKTLLADVVLKNAQGKDVKMPIAMYGPTGEESSVWLCIGYGENEEYVHLACNKQEYDKDIAKRLMRVTTNLGFYED